MNFCVCFGLVCGCLVRHRACACH